MFLLPYLSIPLTIPILTYVNHRRGPSPALRLTNKTADLIQNWFSPNHNINSLPPTECAERWIWRISHYTPKAACLERACALKVFLSFYGVSSTVVIGHSNSDGPLALHAWLEAGKKQFFYDGNFSANWRSDADVEPSMPSV